MLPGEPDSGALPLPTAMAILVKFATSDIVILPCEVAQWPYPLTQWPLLIPFNRQRHGYFIMIAFVQRFSGEAGIVPAKLIFFNSLLTPY